MTRCPLMAFDLEVLDGRGSTLDIRIHVSAPPPGSWASAVHTADIEMLDTFGRGVDAAKLRSDELRHLVVMARDAEHLGGAVADGALMTQLCDALVRAGWVVQFPARREIEYHAASGREKPCQGT